MKKTFKCSCKGHMIKIEYINTTEWINSKTKKKYKENIPELWIGIYALYGSKSGRKLKKPKLIDDVLFIGAHDFDKELDFIMKFLEDIVMQYITRKK